MKMEQQNRITTSRLFSINPVDVKKDDIEEKYERGYQLYQSLINGMSDKETIDTLTSAINRDKSQEDMISLGMLTIILTEPQNAEKVYQDLRMLNRDGFTSVTTNTLQLIVERYTRLHDVARCQLLWLIREMVRNTLPSIDTLCWNLMRHAASGDVSPKNLYLIENLLDLYQENRKWLESHPGLVPFVVYAYLRFIEDHTSPSLLKLKQKEVTFVVSLMRDRFTDCITIGRDLVRLLQNVARIPEIETFCKDLLCNPTALAPNFTGILQILQTRTSRRFLQSRLTPDMERKMNFMAFHVRFGQHKRYQEWFQKQYLTTPESQSLRSDLIRFIVGVIHPTNEILCSDIIPRWAVIGWLITTCTSNIALANSKLALFYDWLFFEPTKDSIMNIEPAILVMNNSQKTHAAVTASLLDFLCRIIPNYYPQLTDVVRSGVYCSLSQILEKRVLPSLSPLFDNPKLDHELRVKIRETFGEFCESAVEISSKPPEIITLDSDRVPSPVINNHIGSNIFGTNSNNSDNVNSIDLDMIDPPFSDDEGDIPSVEIKIDENNEDDAPIVKVKMKETVSEDPFSEVVKTLNKEMKDTVIKLNKEKDDRKRCILMNKLVTSIVREGNNMNTDTLSNIAFCLHSCLESKFEEKVFPDEESSKNIEDVLETSLFILLRGLVESSEGNSKQIPFFTILTELRTHQPKIGYLLLFYLQAIESCNNISIKSTSSKCYLYKLYCHNLDKKFEDCLLCDLEMCQEHDCYLFCWLLPALFDEYPRILVGNEKILHLIVSTIDSKQLQDLVCKVLRGQLMMFQAESFVALITTSLSWETFEQFCLWQLAIAHNIPLSSMMNALPKLEFKTHSEALTTIILLLRREKPSLDLLKPIFCRELKPVTDVFVMTVLQAWCDQDCDVLGNCVADLLTSRCPTASPTKRKRGQGQGLGSRPGVSPPSAEKILAHLDRSREGCKPMFKVESMQRVLQIAQAACTDTQRSLYRNIFALLEIDEPVATALASTTTTSSSTKSLTAASKGGRGARKTVNSSGTTSVTNSTHTNKRNASRLANLKEYSESSENNSSEEEEIRKPRNTKKRRKVTCASSDSD